ncbi:DegT/DnrJ/EryC1/StrS family aminotransferase [Methanobacterium sp. ACI-7]|uniref:DegT/DnrJ/EryC1/StrS family aminotransferase n=1 Tax=unclassified Methanobacterium TaxID=2627676 RepID=UPI0039C1D638
MIPIAKPFIGDEEIKEVEAVLKSGMIAQGPKVAEFEQKFADYIGTNYAVATSSGTTALHVALLAAGIGKEDEVITTPFSFAATANSILYVNAKPVFVDIDPKTYNIDPKRIEEAITDKTKAIMPVHLYGQPAEMNKINKIAEEHDLKVIEDAAQAHGAVYNGIKVGLWGEMACFSFYPTKNITTSEGGIITTNSSEFDHNARALRAHGESERYEHVTLGYNFRMTDISAAIGVVQVRRLDGFNEKRIENAEYLTEHIKHIEGIEPPFVMDNVKHVFHQYTIRISNGKRDELKEFLTQEGIGTGVHYPKAIYKQSLYENLGFTADCPHAEKAAEEVLSIPVNPALTAEDLGKIVSLLEDASDRFLS